LAAAESSRTAPLRELVVTNARTCRSSIWTVVAAADPDCKKLGTINVQVFAKRQGVG
jgi:hypothetical protein